MEKRNDSISYRIQKTLLTEKILVSNSLSPLFGILVFLILSYLYWNRSQFSQTEYLNLKGSYISDSKEYWRAWTTIFLHGDLKHLLSNSLPFFGFGLLIRNYFGFILFPVLTFAMAGVTNLIVINYYPPNISLIGASGWVYLLAATWLTLYLLIDRRHSLKSRIVRAFGVALILLWPTSYEPNISYMTHLVGFLIGIPIAIFYFLLQKKNILKHEEWVAEVNSD